MQRQCALPALERAKQLAKTIQNDSIDAFKARGGRVVGCFDPETPVEILEAAGLMPYNMRGTGAEGTEFADAYFKQLTCEFARTTFNQVISGDYAFVDGSVIYNCCDHLRRVYDNWKAQSDSPCYHFIYVPKHRSATTYERYCEEIDAFVKATEERFGVEITAEKLAAAIAESNRTRALIRELYELRKGEKVYITGSEVVDVLTAGGSIPRAEFNALLRDVIDQVRTAGEFVIPNRRLMLCAGHAAQTELVEVLESQGGIIVADDLSNGLRMAACDIACEADPLATLKDYYFWKKPTMPRVAGTQDARMQRIIDLVNDYQCDGVISLRLTMCDLWAFEQYLIAQAMQEADIAHTALEVNYIIDGLGQIATRVQAFVENCPKRA